MNIPSRFFTGLLAICFSYWLTPVIDAGAAGLKQAEITRIYNTVEVVSSGGATKIASVNEKVRGDQAVRTGVQSRAELLFGDQTLTRLGANTYFSFSNGTRDISLPFASRTMMHPADRRDELLFRTVIGPLFGLTSNGVRRSTTAWSAGTLRRVRRHAGGRQSSPRLRSRAPRATSSVKAGIRSTGSPRMAAALESST